MPLFRFIFISRFTFTRPLSLDVTLCYYCRGWIFIKFYGAAHCHRGMGLKLHGPQKTNNVCWRWKPSLVPLVWLFWLQSASFFRRMRWERASISLAYETRCLPIRVRERQEYAGAGIQRAKRAVIQTVIEKRWIEIYWIKHRFSQKSDSLLPNLAPKNRAPSDVRGSDREKQRCSRSLKYWKQL